MTASTHALYAPAILAHAATPHGATLPVGVPYTELSNPWCGDRVRVALRLHAGVLRQLACQVRGCALCVASGSMMVGVLEGASVAQADALGRALRALADPAAGEGAVLPAPLDALAPVRDFPERARCVTLPWEALQRACAEAG